MLIFEHHKFSGNSFNFGNFRSFYFLNILPSFSKNVRSDIFGLYTFIVYICWYINCLLYVFFNIKYEYNITLRNI